MFRGDIFLTGPVFALITLRASRSFERGRRRDAYNWIRKKTVKGLTGTLVTPTPAEPTG
jgi:hypothetical protein